MSKRVMSVLLLLAMLCSVFSGLTVSAAAAEPTSAAEVVYRKSGDYVYNWGKRDTTATFLTTYAASYYTGSYSFDVLSKKSGSQATGAKAIYDSDLGKALHTMLAAKQTRTTSYGDTKELYRYTDCQQNEDKISSFYSGKAIGPGWGEGEDWNREHTWPNSKGLNGADENDIMMLRPTAISENSHRGNDAYGESRGFYDPNEFNKQLHGDVARLMLQHLIRWGNTNKFYGSGGVLENRALLLKWLKEDPVDTWEMGRNDAVQSITGVRNVFVDYPELAFRLLGEEVPANYPTPSSGNSSACDHVWDAGKVTTEPTCTEKGVKTYTCSKCGNTKTEELPALGHIDENKDELCDRCGAKLGEDPKPTGNKYVKAASLKDGDEVVLFNPAQGKALSKEIVATYYKVGTAVTPTDGVLETSDTAIVWTVAADGTGFNLINDEGKKLSIEGTFSSIPYDKENDAWTVQTAATAGCVYVVNENGKYISWSSKGNFAAYTFDATKEADYALELYVKSAEEPQPSKDITVCFTNDVHGAYELYPYAATAMKGADLIVDAGDNIQGSVATTLTNGQCMVDLMKTVGYDVAVPGNHEFDYGFDRFLEIVNGDNTPYVSANLWDKTADKAVLDAYKLFTVGDKKVAVVGITTPETLVKSTPAFFQNAAGEYIYDFCNDTTGEKLYTVVQKAVDAAKAEGADYVIAVGHLGIDEQSEPWTSTSVIANTTGIDALIDGHSHSTFATTQKNKDGKEIPVAQTGTKLENVGKLTIAADGTITATLLPLYEVKTRVNETTGKEEKYNVYLYDTDPTVAAKVAEIKAEVDKVSNTVVARTEVDLTTLDPTTGKRAVRSAETNLGDLCADAYRELLKTDVAFVNGGGVRANINKGDITYGQIIAVHPFGNTACKIEVTGEQLWTALEIGSAACPGESGGFLQVSGIEYTINTAIPTPARFNENKEFVKLEGEHRVTDVKVNGEPLDVNKTYTLGGHNYMLINGGDGYTVFKGSKILAQEVAIDNEVLIKYITGTLNGVVGADSIYANPTGAGRIKIVTPAHEHTYGDVKYTWTADGETFTCTAYKECTVSGCGDKLTATGTVTAKDDPAATCTAEGKRVFTATFTEDGFGTDTKTVDLPALGHVDEDKDNKCDRCGETLSTPATGARYEKVTEDQKDWSGTYLIVYEASETEAYVFSGVDAHGNLVTATFTDGKIPSSDAIKACEVTVAKEGDGYSFKLNGGANAGKYLTAYSGRNKIVFSDSAKALSIKVEDGVVKVLDGTAPFQFNKTNNDNGLWFRFFGKKSGGQSEIALYKLAN